jgi:hypothetical protein
VRYGYEIFGGEIDMLVVFLNILSGFIGSDEVCDLAPVPEAVSA